MMLTVQRLPLLLLLSAAASSRAVVSSDESTASTHQSLPHLEGEVGDGVGRGAAREGGGGGVFGLARTRHRSLQEGERPPKGSWKKKAVTPPEPKAGVPWTADDRSAWADTRVPEQRSYADDVLTPMHMLRERLRGVMIVGQYGELAVDPNKYPLYFARSLHWRSERPSVLITGGVHGYELTPPPTPPLPAPTSPLPPPTPLYPLGTASRFCLLVPRRRSALRSACSAAASSYGRSRRRSPPSPQPRARARCSPHAPRWGLERPPRYRACR